jgi:hypothetical protein
VQCESAELAIEAQAVAAAGWKQKAKNPEEGWRVNPLHLPAANRAICPHNEGEESSYRARAADENLQIVSRRQQGLMWAMNGEGGKQTIRVVSLMQ